MPASSGVVSGLTSSCQCLYPEKLTGHDFRIIVPEMAWLLKKFPLVPKEVQGGVGVEKFAESDEGRVRLRLKSC